MDVACNICQKEYRLNEALFQGARGIQIRCRSCGNSILAVNPEVDHSTLFSPGFSTPSRGRRTRKRKLRWLSLLINSPGNQF